MLLGLLVHYATFLLVYYNMPALSIADSVSKEDSFGILFDPSK